MIYGSVPKNILVCSLLNWEKIIIKRTTKIIKNDENNKKTKSTFYLTLRDLEFTFTFLLIFVREMESFLLTIFSKLSCQIGTNSRIKLTLSISTFSFSLQFLLFNNEPVSESIL